jgi:hypothetical protein
VAPQPIENKLKNNVLVAQAALVGDKHKFISRADLAQLCRAGGVGQQHGIEAKDRAPNWWPTAACCPLRRDCARGERQPGQL